MANIYPTQTRTVDPYSEYNSNIVNRLTRIASLAYDSLHEIRALDVEKASDTSVTVKTGTCYKDDVLIQITDDFSVDMTDEDFYVSGPAWSEEGYYLIVLDYVYAKAMPPPKASIKILKPTQHALLTEQYLFLKCVEVEFVGPSFRIVDVHDYVPSNETIRRNYIRVYAGGEVTLPSFVLARDEGRFVYAKNKKDLYFGTDSGWEFLGTVRDAIDTTSCQLGDLAYIASDGKAYPAIATSATTLANCAVTSVGLKSDGTGRVRILGRLSNVRVETGISLSVGDDVFLSSSEEGRITNVAPALFPQFVGTVIEVSGSDITIWFTPDFGFSRPKSVRATLLNWSSSGGYYYSDVDVSAIGNSNSVCCKCFDSSTKTEIIPYKVEIVDKNTLRVWMPINTKTLNVLVSG